MANLKMNFKTEFLYLEENFLDKLTEILNGYSYQKVLFVTDNESRLLIRQNLKKLNCDIAFFKKENDYNCCQTSNNDTISQFINKDNLKSHLEGFVLIVGIGGDNEINITKQISAEFEIPYITVLRSENSSICYSEFFVQNLEIKKGFLPLGIIVDLNNSSDCVWMQKLLVENAKIRAIKCLKFFDEIFLGKQNFCMTNIDDDIDQINNKNGVKDVKNIAEVYCDYVLLQQHENIFQSLFLLVEIYKTISQKNSLNNEFILYKTLIKVYEIFTKNFMTKYKCFKCYDLTLSDINKNVINSSYIKYILTNFNDLIERQLKDFYEDMLQIEESLNDLSYINMYKDKNSMYSNNIIKSFKIFAKIQKSPTYLNIIDFYNLF